MSTQTEITRIQTARNTIRTKLVDLGLATSTTKIDALATAVEGIENRGAVSANVVEGATYTIPKGYHNGSGTVSGVAGGGNYSLQSKSITPTKAQQNVTPDSGYYGLSDVTVNPIPDNYHDTTSVTATAADVLANKIIVNEDGETIAGTMPFIGATNGTVSVAVPTYTIPMGYHSGTGKVIISQETKTATPTKAAQDVVPTSGKVLSKVTVEAIPDAYQDVTGVTATVSDVLKGAKFVRADGTLVEGNIPSHSALTDTPLDTTTTSYTIPRGYHTGKSTVSITLETKTATPTKAAQDITPTSGKVLSKVTVNPIPDNFIDTTDADAVAANILDGKTAYVNTVKIEGTMANNGDTSKTIDGLTTTSATIPAGYTTGGTVSLTDDIETALAAI